MYINVTPNVAYALPLQLILSKKEYVFLSSTQYNLNCLNLLSSIYCVMKRFVIFSSKYEVRLNTEHVYCSY